MRLAGYRAPESLDDAVQLLGANGDSRPLAGGYSLLVEPHRSSLAQATLVDLRRVPDLDGIQGGSGEVRIGAMARLGELAGHEEIQTRYAAVAQAARATGDAQVRNRATVGGTLADADPEADLPAALLACDAQVEIQGGSGSRTAPVDELVVGPGETSLASGELIVAVALPGAPGQPGSAYEKFTHPATLYAICGVAAAVGLGGDGSIEWCRCAVTGATEAPTRLQAVEQAVSQGSASQEDLAAAAQQAGEISGLRGDHFASEEYRRQLAIVLSERALVRAVEQAKR